MFIETKQLKDIFIKLINKESLNRDFVIEQLIDKIGDDKLSWYTQLLSSDKPVELFSEGELVKVDVENELGKYNIDILIDLGVYENGFMFGYIDKTPSYTSVHDPYAGYQKVNILVHDVYKNIISKDINVPTYNIHKTDKILLVNHKS